MWTELTANARVDVEGAIGRSNSGPAKIINRVQDNRAGIRESRHRCVGFRDRTPR